MTDNREVATYQAREPIQSDVRLGADDTTGDVDRVDDESSQADHTLEEAADSETASHHDADADAVAAQRGPHFRPAAALGLVAVVALGALAGWLGYRAFQSHQVQQQRELMLAVGRQAALNLTTIRYTEADADVARIVDVSTGAFRDDFQKRAPAFIEAVKQAQSKSEGTITGAGLESYADDQGQVMVAVSVKSTTAAAINPRSTGWRMRIAVQQAGDGPKVSNVEFVP